VDRQAACAVRRADRQRLLAIQRFFQCIGHDATSARIRSRIVYSVQIGCCAVDGRHPRTRRRDMLPYLRSLCDPGSVDRQMCADRQGRQPARSKTPVRKKVEAKIDWMDAL
jgi:hypothetical protein